MKQIIEDITKNCPECECSPEETVKFLMNRGDISLTCSNYREVWLFYKKSLEVFDGKINSRKKKARELTMEMMGVCYDKFRHIRTWANKHNI